MKRNKTVTTHPLATAYHSLKGKVKFTEWLAIPIKNPDEDSFSVGSRFEIYSNSTIKKLIKSYPSDKMKFDQDGTKFIPLFSTFKGWKWNMEQIFNCIDMYPAITLRILYVYLANDYSQAIFRKIFGKHFRQFIRELNKLPAVRRFCEDKRFRKYKVFNSTPEGLNSGFAYRSESVHGISFHRFHVLLYPGLFANFDDLEFELFSIGKKKVANAIKSFNKYGKYEISDIRYEWVKAE